MTLKTNFVLKALNPSVASLQNHLGSHSSHGPVFGGTPGRQEGENSVGLFAVQLHTTCKECTRGCCCVLFSPSFWYIRKALFASLNNSVIYLRSACDAQSVAFEESFLKSRAETSQVNSVTYHARGLGHAAASR